MTKPTKLIETPNKKMNHNSTELFRNLHQVAPDVTKYYQNC